MHIHSLNWPAIVVAAVVTMVLGFLWYSPLSALSFDRAWHPATQRIGWPPPTWIPPKLESEKC